MKEVKNYGGILRRDKEIAPYLDKFPHWEDLKKEGRFEKEKALLCVQNWVEKFKKINVRKQDEVFKINEYPSLATLKKYLDKEYLDTLLATLIQNFVALYSNISPLKPEQIEVLLRLIFKDFHYLNLADLSLFFDNMLRGVYGKIYGRLDVEVILTNLASYDKERIETGGQVSLNNYNQEKSKPQETHKDIAKLFDERLKLPKLPEVQEAVIEQGKIEFNDVCAFAKYRSFEVRKLSAYCHQLISSQYETLIELSDKALKKSELEYSTLWFKQLFTWINDGNTEISEQEFYKFIQNLRVQETT